VGHPFSHPPTTCDKICCLQMCYEGSKFVLQFICFVFYDCLCILGPVYLRHGGGGTSGLRVQQDSCFGQTRAHRVSQPSGQRQGTVPQLFLTNIAL
jgi:hypothetical protein